MKKKNSSAEDAARKRQASDMLKNADKLLKAGDFKSALKEIDNALEIDPGNFYARAYKDRILSAKQHGTEKSSEVSISQDEEEFKKKLHAEQQRIEEETKRNEAERQRAEEELRRRALEDETKRSQEEESKKRREEETKKKLDQERQRVEVETRKRIDEEKQRLQEELRKREEFARQHAEEEALRKAKQEEEFIRKEQEKGRQEALNQKVESYLIRSKQHFDSKAYEESLTEIFKIYSLLPEHLEARQIETLINKEKLPIEEEKLKELKIIPRQSYIEKYKRFLILAWSEGLPSQEEQSLIVELGAALNISPDEHQTIEPSVKSEAYVNAVRKAWQDGTLSPEEVKHLERLRDELDITAEEHLSIEQRIRKELGY
ncbi:MAG: hypothetical protein QME52_03540 [Bacteroidota bacterium]|nr:hypothetical protein [Bacteroidota bacterium]